MRRRRRRRPTASRRTPSPRPRWPGPGARPSRSSRPPGPRPTRSARPPRRRPSASWPASAPRSTGSASAATRSPPSWPRCATWWPGSPATTPTSPRPQPRQPARSPRATTRPALDLRAPEARRPSPRSPHAPPPDRPRSPPAAPEPDEPDDADETDDGRRSADLGRPGPRFDRHSPFYIGFFGGLGFVLASWLFGQFERIGGVLILIVVVAVPRRRPQPVGRVVPAPRPAAQPRRDDGDRPLPVRGRAVPVGDRAGHHRPGRPDHRQRPGVVRPAPAQPAGPGARRAVRHHRQGPRVRPGRQVHLGPLRRRPRLRPARAGGAGQRLPHHRADAVLPVLARRRPRRRSTAWPPPRAASGSASWATGSSRAWAATSPARSSSRSAPASPR